MQKKMQTLLFKKCNEMACKQLIHNGAKVFIIFNLTIIGQTKTYLVTFKFLQLFWSSILVVHFRKFEIELQVDKLPQKSLRIMY